LKRSSGAVPEAVSSWVDVYTMKRCASARTASGWMGSKIARVPFQFGRKTRSSQKGCGNNVTISKAVATAGRGPCQRSA
jgi:hypothetical protein